MNIFQPVTLGNDEEGAEMSQRRLEAIVRCVTKNKQQFNENETPVSQDLFKMQLQL